jgi:hypothetical protein
MLHFPSTLRANSSSSSSNGAQKRTESLNATQQKSGSNPALLKIEEELHDARRVHAHGQEEDLRLALDMVINRVTELVRLLHSFIYYYPQRSSENQTSLLTEAYKTQADLEVQLNVAKSNLALVIANNEMLEDALKRDTSGTSSRDIGWRRRSGKEGEERQSLEEWQQVPSSRASTDYLPGAGTCENSQPNSTVHSPQIPNQQSGPGSTQEASRFFKFRFASSSRPTTRPSTPTLASTGPSPQIPPGPSPVLPPVPGYITKELEDLNSELQKERSARKAVESEKTNLEAELESLSQALFEEVRLFPSSHLPISPLWLLSRN